MFGDKKLEQSQLCTSLIKTINEKYNEHNYDIIFLNYFAFNDFVTFLKKFFPRSNLFIDTNDVQFKRYRQIYKGASKIKYFTKLISLKRFELNEKRALNKIDHIISLSKSDFDTFKSFGCQNVINIPQGLPIKDTITTNKSENNIAFFGEMSGTANVVTAIYFKDNIFPLVKKKIADVYYYIVGSNPSPEIIKLNSEDTIVTGYVEDIHTFFNNIKCVVCPFNFTYGQRTRILEVMSYGIPCVVSSKSIEGMELQNGNGIFIEDDAKGFALRVSELLSNDNLRIEQSYKAYDYIKNNYSFENTFKKLSNIISNI